METREQFEGRLAPGTGLPTSEWLSPADLEREFSLSHTTAWRVCKALPHLSVGKRGIRVARRDVLAAVRDGHLKTLD